MRSVIAVIILLACLAVAGCADPKTNTTPTATPTPTLTPTATPTATSAPAPAPTPEPPLDMPGYAHGYVVRDGQPQRDAHVFWDGDEIGLSDPQGWWHSEPGVGQHTVYAEYGGKRSPEYTVTQTETETMRVDLIIGGQ